MASYEALAVSNTAVPITGTLYDSHENYALVVCETAAVRIRYDGTAPTASVGTPMEPGDSITLCDGEIAAFQAIRRDAVDAVLHVHCSIRPEGSRS